MGDRLVERISREAGVPDLVEILAERLSPTDLQSLLLAVYRRRAAAVTPAKLLERYEQNRFARPSDVDPAALDAFDRAALAELPPGYARIELSPVAPLGTVAALTGLNQDWAVSTSRNTEVVSDVTNVLALECASRRRGEHAEIVRLWASHRQVRGQAFGPGLSQHFRLFGLCAAGRDTGSLSFETISLAEQLAFYLGLLVRLGCERVRVTLSEPDADGTLERLRESAIEALAQRFPAIAFAPDPDPHSGRGYYVGVRFQIYAAAGDGDEAHVADGGFTRWTQALLSDRKERLLTSGIGSERVCGLL